MKWLLIVEDEEDVFDALAEGLARQGDYRVVGAKNASEAAIKLRNQKFDCLLLDMRLGRGTSGEDVIDNVRRETNGLNFETPVVVMSAYLEPDLVRRIGSRVSSMLVKPFNILAVREKIQAAIASHPVQPRLA
jgi:DNA-binding response OmpR family regulator